MAVSPCSDRMRLEWSDVVAGKRAVVSGDFRPLDFRRAFMITDPLFYAVAVPSVTLLGLAKGGFSGLGLLALPLMALVISPVQAAAVTLPILIVQDVVSVWAYRRSFDSRNLAVLLPAATLGIGLGYLLAAEVSDAAVKLAVGVISVAFALRRLVVEHRHKLPPAAMP